MDVVGVVGIIVGVLGGAAGVWSAVWVYRRQRADRDAERAEERRRDAEQAKLASQQRQKESEQRELELRREKYREHYRNAEDILERATRIGYDVQISGYLTRSKGQEVGLIGLDEQFERVAARIPHLELTIGLVSYGLSDLERALLPDDVDPKLISLIRRCIQQEAVSAEIQNEAKKAKAAIDRDWRA